VLRLTSRDGTLVAILGLDFAAERLIYDPMEAVAVLDDGSVGAARSAIDRLQLLRGLILNGQLEAWDSERVGLLGRCDPHVPLNIDLRRSLENLDRIQAEIESEVQRRSPDSA
jgi:hypothetical protein